MPPAAITRMSSRRAVLGLTALLGAAAPAHSQFGATQFTNGGEVPVTCTDCVCEGTTEDGDIMVFDNPSTGNRVVSVDGEYSEIAETECGTSVFAAGSTIYQLSGVDLASRDLEAVDMTDDADCASSSGAPATAECYSGTPDVRELDNGASLTLNLCLCIDTQQSSTSYYSRVNTRVVGASAVDTGDLSLCIDAGFVSMLLSVAVDEESNMYNFDLVVPGRTSSADLVVASAPDSQAQTFSCDGVEPTASPTAPTPEPVAPVTTTTAPVPAPTAGGASIDGGDIGVACTSCSCEGAIPDGDDIIVFDSPSSGDRVVYVDGGEYYEVFETPCSQTAFATGDTYYVLEGVDLVSRELEVVDMTADDSGDCASSSGASATADCYSGAPDAKDVGDGVSFALGLCYCTETEGLGSSWWSSVSVQVAGTNSLDLQGQEVCNDAGFTSMTVDVAVDGETYLFNFDLAVPGEPSSADLSVTPAAGVTQCSTVGTGVTASPVEAQTTVEDTSARDDTSSASSTAGAAGGVGTAVAAFGGMIAVIAAARH